jgi:hypothetical protein
MCTPCSPAASRLAKSIGVPIAMNRHSGAKHASAIGRTIGRMPSSTGADSVRETQTKGRAAEARTKVRRLQDAIAAGANPAALVDAINTAQAELEAAEAEQARQPASKTISRAEVYAMIDYLGDVGAALERGDPAELQKLYEKLRLEMIYQRTRRRSTLRSAWVGIVNVSEDRVAR